MKKILLLFCALLATMGAVKAETFTITVGFDGGTFYQNANKTTAYTERPSTNTWSSCWVSNETPEITLIGGSAWNLLNDTYYETDYTLSVSGNFVITGYSITPSSLPNGSANLTPSGGSAQAFNAGSANTVSGLSASSVSFSLSDQVVISNFTITVESVSVITSLDEIKKTSTYTITTKGRGSWYDNGSLGCGGTTIGEYAFVTYNGNQYIYSVSSKKFMCHELSSGVSSNNNRIQMKDTDLSLIASGFTFTSTNDSDFPIAIYDGNGYMFNVGGGGQLVLNTWTSLDVGNQLKIVEAATDFDDAEAIAKLEFYFNPSATVKYIISDATGVILTSDAISTNVGETITALPSNLQRAFCSYSEINHTVTAGENTINVTVTYGMPFEEGKWYYMTLRGHNVYYSSAANDVRTNQSGKEETQAYQWGFSGTPYTGIKVQNRQTGTYLTNTASTVQLTESGFAWTLAQLNNTTIFGLANGANYINEQNHSNHNLIYWTNFTTDTGSQFNVEEVEDDGVVYVTYNVVIDGTTVLSVEQAHNAGDAPAIPSELERDYTTYSFDVETISATTTTVTVRPTFNMPFTTSTDYESATWYYATLRGKQLRADDNYKDSSSRYQTNSSNERTDVYKWAFIGNPVEGIQIINKGAGSGKYLYKGTQPIIQEVAPESDANARWNVSPNSNGGFTVCSASTANWYINDAGNAGVLGFWANTAGANDAGSKWVITEVTASDKTALGEAITAAQILVSTPEVLGYPTAAAASTLSSAITAAQSVYNNPTGDYITACNTLNEAIAVAQTNIVYTPRTDVYYTITSARGSMVYDASHDNHEDADGNKFLWYTTSLDNTDVNHLWGFIEQDGKYYMYNVGRKQFATVSTSGSYQLNDKGTWAFSDAPAYMTFDAGINNSVAAPNVRIRATVATTGSTYSMSISTSYIGPVITYDAQGDGGIPMRFATSTVAVDADITAEMIEKVEDITPYFTTLKNLIDACALLPIGDGTNKYATSEAYTAALEAANITYANTESTKSELQTATANLESAIASLTLNLPAAGFYRIKGKTSGKYLAAGLASNNKFNMSDATDATTIFYFDGTTLRNASTGLYNGMNSTTWAWVEEEEASTVVFLDGLTNGGYAIKSNDAYFYDNGDNSNSADRGGNLTINASTNGRYTNWYLEPASLPGDVNNDGSVTIADVTALVNIILGKDTENVYNHEAADVNGDEGITIADVTALVNIILGKSN